MYESPTLLTRKHQTTPSCFQSGLTLVELLISIGIVGVLSTGIIAGISGARDRAREAAALLQLKNIERAIAMLELDTGLWPGAATPYRADCQGSGVEYEDLSTGTVGLLANGGAFSGWSGPYLDSLETDPWDNAYFIDYDYGLGSGTTAAVVGSYGPNGTGLNNYDSDDVILILASRSDC